MTVYTYLSIAFMLALAAFAIGKDNVEHHTCIVLTSDETVANQLSHLGYGTIYELPLRKGYCLR